MKKREKLKLLFATSNEHKILEVKNILNSEIFKILSLSGFSRVPEIEETGKTFEENAFIKAETVYKQFGIPVIADDSGLAVEQLGGAPGIYSSRYAGASASDAENNQKLLEELSRFPEPHLAKFVCCAVFYDGKNKISVTGELHGRIINKPEGKFGFGYDPVFLPEGFNKTLAEFLPEDKNKISHRAKAFEKLGKILDKLYSEGKI